MDRPLSVNKIGSDEDPVGKNSASVLNTRWTIDD